MMRMFVAVVATVLVGCADGAAPVIENLEVDQMEIVVGVENTVSFTLDFSDSDGDVAQAQVEIVRQDDGTVLLSSATPIEGAAGVEAGRFTGGVSITPQEAGFFYFRVTVIDETANESNALSESIEIVEALSE